MSDLSVAEYNRAEADAICELPNRIVEAFQPVVFQQLGYPSRVSRESELWKYIDVMHEGRFEADFSNLLEGISPLEFSVLGRLTEQICRFSNSKFGYKAIAKASVLRSLNVLRHIKYLFGDARPTVLEIGPGCGYLGAMLLLESYPYVATDVAQAFYLYQNHFWNFITEGKVIELARDSGSKGGLPAPAPGEVVHVPWWRFASLRPGDAPPFAVVTCNHTFCEMHPACLGFTLSIARDFENGTQGPTFVFEGWGSGVKNSASSVAERFYRSGFAIAHHDSKITIIDLKSSQGHLDLPKHKQRLLRKSRSLLRRLAGARPLGQYEPRCYASSSSPWSKAILEGRSDAANTVGINLVNQFYFDLLGTEPPPTPDEQFRMLAGHRN